MSSPTLDQVVVGGVVWAYARGYWRESRVLSVHGKTKVVVAYNKVTGRGVFIGRILEQAVKLSKIRLEKPTGFRVLHIHAPAGSPR